MVKLRDAALPVSKERKPAVLVVEDEFVIRTALSDYLEDCEFVVYDVPNAAEAVAVLQAEAIPIDAVLTDVRMPGAMDGLGLARWIGENRAGLPVLITTGDKAATARGLCSENSILEKPHDLKLVAARIRAAIEAAKRNSA